jgi:hypothetical protein
MPTRTGRRRVYICGPISADIGVPHREKILRFYNAEAWLRNVGRIGGSQISRVINPLKVPPACNLLPSVCAANSSMPSQSGQDGAESHAWECYMRADIAALMTCDDIVLLPRWEESKGAIQEHTLARRVGIIAHEFTFNLDGTHPVSIERMFA